MFRFLSRWLNGTQPLTDAEKRLIERAKQGDTSREVLDGMETTLLRHMKPRAKVPKDLLNGATRINDALSSRKRR